MNKLSFFADVPADEYHQAARDGEIVCVGTPEEVARCEASYTGRYLREKLK